MSSEKASNYKKVKVPDFTNAENPCNDNRFFNACYHFSFLIWSHVWTKFLNLDEVWQVVNDAWEKDTEPNKQPKEAHQESYNIIKAIDPTLFCWYNYFLLSLLSMDMSRKESKLKNVSKAIHKNTRRYAWYSVVHFVNQKSLEHEDISSDYYQAVYEKLQNNKTYKTTVAEIDRKKLVDFSTRQSEDMDITWFRLLNFITSLTSHETETAASEETKKVEVEGTAHPESLILDPRNMLGNTLELLMEETQIQFKHNKAILNALAERRAKHQELIQNIDTDRALILERISTMKVKIRKVHAAILLGNDDHRKNLSSIEKTCK